MKVSELSGAMLNYWVAKAEGKEVWFFDGMCVVPQGWFEPITNWEQGGPIIQRMHLDVYWKPAAGGVWFAKAPYLDWKADGKTPLIAAMRVYVASKFGTEVDYQRLMES